MPAGIIRFRLFDEQSGRHVWSSKVDGRAYGLAVSNGKLYVSTDKGTIHCFSNQKNDGLDKVIVKQDRNESYVNEKRALTILEQTAITKGYCLILGCEDGRLASVIGANSQLNIICLDTDVHKIAKLRNLLDEQGLYGRVTVKQWDGRELPFTQNLFNLIIAADGSMLSALSLNDVVRVLRPYGGTVWLEGAGDMPDNAKQSWISVAKANDCTVDFFSNYTIVRRGSLKGTGSWTQLYADASHTACSDDEIEGPLNIQWFGRPGPREIVDRHHRPMSSLFLEGRLFIPANNKVICADAYNGSLIWQREVLQSRRIGVMKDSGQMLVDKQHLYITANSLCKAYNVIDGTPDRTYSVSNRQGDSYDWGYLNITDDCLVGTAENKNASFYEMDFSDQPLNGSNVLEGDFKEVIISENIFALDRETGKERWRHDKGKIMTVLSRYITTRSFLLNQEVLMLTPRPTGRVRIDDFCKEDLYLTAIDVRTGRIKWSRKLSFPISTLCTFAARSGPYCYAVHITMRKSVLFARRVSCKQR